MAEPQPVPVHEQKNDQSPNCADLITMAERELGAFFTAVTELFGSEQARLSAKDWLDELELMDSLPGSASRDWLRVTLAASARLASRLTAGRTIGRGTSRRLIPKYRSIPSSNRFASPLLAQSQMCLGY